MNIIKSWNGRTIRIREDGYFSLTDMAQINGKQVGHWLALDSTSEYLVVLESSIGIPIDVLIQKITNGVNEQRGTWAHRRVALRFAQWCNVDFAIQVDCWVEELMTTGSVHLESDRDHLERTFHGKASIKDIKETCVLYRMAFGKCYQQRYIHQQIKKHHPMLAGDDPLPNEYASVSQGQCLLTPTKIAQELNILYKTGNPNPRVVNSKLAELGYQIKVGDQWSATEKSISLKLCDRKPVDTGSKTQKDQLLWSSEIIEILKEHFVTSA